MAGKVGDLTRFPVNGQSGCSLQIRGGHQEGGILSYTLGQGIGVRVDHTLWAQVRVETAWLSAHCLPSTVWGEGKQLDCLCIGEWRGGGGYSVGLWLFHSELPAPSIPS